MGDKIYGPDENIYIRFVQGGMTDADRLLLVLDRQALHAASLGIRHPLTGELLSYKAEIPEEMKNLLVKISRKTID